MSSPFSLTIDWLSFTLPSGTVKETMGILEGEWIKDKGGFRGYPQCWMTVASDRGVGKLGTGAERAPFEVHVDLSAGIVSCWPPSKVRAVLQWVGNQQGHLTRIDCALDDRAGSVPLTTIKQAIVDGQCITPAQAERRKRMRLVRRGNVWWMHLMFQGRRIRRSIGTSNRVLAGSILAKVQIQLVEGQYFDSLEERTRTFSELMDRFEREHIVKLASRATCEVFVKRFRQFFGDRTLAQITPKLIVEYKSSRYAVGVKAATINREMTCLKKAFNLAKREWEWCRDNPVSRVSAEKGREQTGPLADGRRGGTIAHRVSLVVARTGCVRAA